MISFVGCKKDEPQEPKNPATQEENNQKEDKDTKGPKLNVYEIETDAAGGEYKVQLTSTSSWSALSDKKWVSLDPEMGNGNAIVNVRVKPGTESDTAKINFVNDEGSKVLLVYRVMPGTSEDMHGEFSVSVSRKVIFAPGNLQYQASTQTWRFAENQYDVIGMDNENISDTYSGWIDMFLWGTGDNPTNIYESETFVDWGINKIGSDAANTWRTLSSDEWNYLFTDRENASNLYGSATVNEQAGIIVLPDNTKLSVGFNAGMNGYFQNKYSDTEWQVIEDEGAIFLPAAGYGYHGWMNEIGGSGNYWSSTMGPVREFSVGAYGLAFEDNILDSRWEFERDDNECSVRLVKDVK